MYWLNQGEASAFLVLGRLDCRSSDQAGGVGVLASYG